MTDPSALRNPDYVIIGGGTAGLVVACRLSEDPTQHMLVLESGLDRINDTRVQDPFAWESLTGSDLDWNFKMAPQIGVNNRQFNHSAGKLLGGTSMINASIFVPPSPAEIDAWGSIGNPDWNWDTLLPYLQKTYTLDSSARGSQSLGLKLPHPPAAIRVSYSVPQGKPDLSLLEAWKRAFQERGYEHTDDLLAETSTLGTRPLAATIDSETGQRSSAASEYGTILSTRSNVTILTGVTARRILFDSPEADQSATATGVEFEVILAAGAFHTPKILELSGIGDKGRLDRLGIHLVSNLPGVGKNLQSHFMGIVTASLKTGTDIDSISPGYKALAFVRLPDNQIQELLSKSHAPMDPRYFEIRGNTHITTADPIDPPSMDPRFLTNDLDLEFLVGHVEQLEEVLSSPSLQPFFQARPTTDRESLRRLLKESIGMPSAHPCGTAAMRPRDTGGVVDQDLKVYGTANVRVVDASVFPLIPHANPIATVYAVAERAADLIQSSRSA
ncbi:choline dehydrogenase [Aspergillus karnatakaensis]|uniref:GMC family oxidoreductase n=1 Tax=Aspergillus karnatakaensis TaxID=1810916 RepID=UPI003CCD60BE